MFVLNKQNKCNSFETDGRTGTYWIQAGDTDYMEMFFAVNNRDTHVILESITTFIEDSRGFPIPKLTGNEKWMWCIEIHDCLQSHHQWV